MEIRLTLNLLMIIIAFRSLAIQQTVLHVHFAKMGDSQTNSASFNQTSKVNFQFNTE